MQTIYIVLIVVLFFTAISDLIVGVSNDAVNFLNAAIGSKPAPFKIIVLVAALGIIIGATFSSGMMEVARKGIFHPEYFYFSEIIIIFLAVMLTDVILLDLFNTFGMPTSTTVSIVFELLGGAVALTLIKINVDPNAMEFSAYINSAKALAIISGILLSVVVSFISGVVIQYFSRMIFTFDYEKRIKRYGGLWGGLAITAITYFMLIKGIKGASFMSDDLKHSIQDNTLAIIGMSFVGWTIILQIITSFTRLNILKFIVLIGTFALAMAFAGNDLVNFIGVPLAGLESFHIFSASGSPADSLLMADLAGKIKTPTLYLLGAGLIMVVTLWTSRKAKAVVKTSVDLGRQEEGFERFGSTHLSRTLVRRTSNIAGFFDKAFPQKMRMRIESRFDQQPFIERQKVLGEDAPAFDLIRASVTLVVASILISSATSLKLPLSTTYVTFMVAMGTSLSDRAWGRETAVYRITGVFSVIGGWFFTALAAFTSAFIMAMLIYFGGPIAIGIIVLIVIYFVYHTYTTKKGSGGEDELAEEAEAATAINGNKIIAKTSKNISKVIIKISSLLKQGTIALTEEDLKKFRKTYKEVKSLNAATKELKDHVSDTISKLEENEVETGHYYVQVLDYLREAVHSVTYLIKPAYDHVDNNHKGLLPDQSEEIKDLTRMVTNLINEINDRVKAIKYDDIDELIHEQQKILKFIDTSRKKQVKRIKANEVGTRNSMLFLSLLSETKALVLNLINILKAHRDFAEEVYTSENGASEKTGD